MGTRGCIGVVVDGTFKGSYNHFDSYPEALGVAMVEQAQTIARDIDRYRVLAKELRLVDEDDKVSKDDFDKYRHLRGERSNGLSRSGHNPDTEWYSLLRDMQGELVKSLEAGVMLDGSTFPHDSLFCEFAYAVNFDDGTLEMYQGFQKDAAAIVGRFKDAPFSDSGYGGVTLVGTFQLNDIPSDWQAQAFPPDDDDE